MVYDFANRYTAFPEQVYKESPLSNGVRVWIELGGYVRPYDDPERGAIYNVQTLNMAGVPVRGGRTKDNPHFFELTAAQLAAIEYETSQLIAAGIKIWQNVVTVYPVTDEERKHFVDYAFFLDVLVPAGTVRVSIEIPR